MGEESNLTRDRILEKSRDLFLEKEYSKVSMREIARELDLTTGALYNCFESKNDLFANIVGEVADELLENFKNGNNRVNTSDIRDEDVSNDVNLGVQEVIDYIYDHYDESKMLFLKSSGSKYENFKDELIEIEEKSTRVIFGIDETSQVDRFFIHVVATTGLLNLIEILRHDLTKDQAEEYMFKMQNFYRNGYLGMLK